MERERLQAERDRTEAAARAERERQQAKREAEPQRTEAAAEAERQRLEAIAATERERVTVERVAAAAAADKERFQAVINAERERAATAAAAEKQRVAAVTSSAASADRDRAVAEQRRFQMEQQRWVTEERQREAQRAKELKRLEVEREKIAAEKERAAEERKALEAARASEIERLLAVQKECMEKRARRLLAEQKVKAVTPQATGTLPSVLPPLPTLLRLTLHLSPLLHHHHRVKHLVAVPLLLLHQLLIAGYLSAVYQLLHTKLTMPSSYCVISIPRIRVRTHLPLLQVYLHRSNHKLPLRSSTHLRRLTCPPLLGHALKVRGIPAIAPTKHRTEIFALVVLAPP